MSEIDIVKVIEKMVSEFEKVNFVCIEIDILDYEEYYFMYFDSKYYWLIIEDCDGFYRLFFYFNCEDEIIYFSFDLEKSESNLKKLYEIVKIK